MTIAFLTGPFDPSLEQTNELIQAINTAIASATTGTDPTFTTLTVSGQSSFGGNITTIDSSGNIQTLGNLHVDGTTVLDNGTITTDGSGALTAVSFHGDGSALTGISAGTTLTGSYLSVPDNDAMYAGSAFNAFVPDVQGGTGGYGDTAWGIGAMITITTGIYNTAFGAGALNSVTTGSANTVIGRVAGAGIIAGNNNTCLGYNTNISSSSALNQTVIGCNAVGIADNSTQIGDSGVTLVSLGTTTAALRNDGTNAWIFGAYTAVNAQAQAGTVTVTINGTPVTLLTA